MRWTRGTDFLCLAPLEAILGARGDASMATLPFCGAALGAVADRRIRTPTSVGFSSATQVLDQAEENWQVRVPRQQPVHQAPPRLHDLARQPHKSVDERPELQPQHPTLLGAMLLLPATSLLRQQQRPPRLQVPGQ